MEEKEFISEQEDFGDSNLGSGASGGNQIAQLPILFPSNIYKVLSDNAKNAGFSSPAQFVIYLNDFFAQQNKQQQLNDTQPSQQQQPLLVSEKPKSRKKLYIILAIVAFVLIVAGVIVFFLLRKKRKARTKAAVQPVTPLFQNIPKAE